MKQNFLRTVAPVLCLAGALPALAATPTVGQPAPALTFTQLLNAPEGTKTDWASLKGKVVVLEFWATWCAPCIAEISHLNTLAASVADHNIQFISVDDEEPAVIQEFVAKKKMAGWVGASEKAFGDYGVQARPTTIVVDGEGKIAGILRPDQLERDALVSLSDGKPVVFPTESVPPILAEAQKKAMMEAAAGMKNPTGDASVEPLFEIAITPGKADGAMMMSTSEDSESGQLSMNVRNATLAMLVPWALGIPADRMTFHGDVTKDHYTLHLAAPSLDMKQLAPALEAAIVAAGGVKLTHQHQDEDVYVLQATPESKAKLDPTVSPHGHMCFVDPRSGNLKMVKTSLDGLAPVIEQLLGFPVVNEAGIAGEFDAGFVLPKDGLDAAKAALETNMGLTLVKGRRSIERIVVDVQPKPAKVEDVAGEKGTPVPGQPAQMIAVPRQ